MLPITVLALETALASSVTITIDVLAMANHVSAFGGPPAPFDVQLWAPEPHLFRPFLAFPEATARRAGSFHHPRAGLVQG